MKRALDKPTNWQDFEDLCFILWKFIWNDPHAQKNGRQGQAQSGVDIYGKPIGQLDIEGVQCKVTFPLKPEEFANSDYMG